MSPRLREYLSYLAGTVAVALAALAAHRIQADWNATLGIAGAAVVAAGISVTAARLETPVRVSAAISALALFLFTAYGTLGDTKAFGVPSWTTVDQWFGGLANGWRATLDAPLPLSGFDSRPEIFLIAITWVAGAVTAELLARTRLNIISVLPSLLLYGAMLALGSPTPRSPLILPVGLAFSILALLTLRSRSFHRDTHQSAEPARLSGRTLGSGLVLGVACVLVAAGGATLLDRSEPFDPRSLQEQRTITRSTANPLLMVKAEQSIDPPVPVLAIDEADDGQIALIDRLSVATLNLYDGTSWKVQADFQPSGIGLSVETPPSVDTASVTGTIRIADLRLPWLPVGSNVSSISIDGAAYDPANQMMLGPTNDLSPTYSITSKVALPTEAELDAATTTVDPDLVAVPPDVPDDVRLLAGQVGAGLPLYRQAQAIETFLHDGYSIDPESPGGHSLGRLEQFLVNDRRGASEQFAASFALLARLKGLPARVVVGYRLTEVVEGEVVSVTEVDTSHTDAWAEVRFDDIGWVAFDPVPPGGGVARDEPPAPTTTLAPQVIDREVLPSEAGPDQTAEESDSDSAGGGLLGPIVLAVIILVLLGLVAMIRLAKGARRRSRIQAGTPADRTIAAWYEATDRLVEHGLEIRPEMTFLDVTQAGVRSFDLPPSSDLWGQLMRASAAAYGGHGTRPADAAEAWKLVAHFGSELGARRSRFQRVSAWVSTRPFRRADVDP